jgi:hypothetical protein
MAGISVDRIPSVAIVVMGQFDRGPSGQLDPRDWRACDEASMCRGRFQKLANARRAVDSDRCVGESAQLIRVTFLHSTRGDDLTLRVAESNRCAYGLTNAFGRHCRFCDVIGRASLHCIEDGLLVAEAGQDDYRSANSCFPNVTQECHPITVRQTEVEERAIECSSGDMRESIARTLRFDDVDLAQPCFGERTTNGETIHFVVIDEQYRQRLRTQRPNAQQVISMESA